MDKSKHIDVKSVSPSRKVSVFQQFVAKETQDIVCAHISMLDNYWNYIDLNLKEVFNPESPISLSLKGLWLDWLIYGYCFVIERPTLGTKYLLQYGTPSIYSSQFPKDFRTLLSQENPLVVSVEGENITPFKVRMIYNPLGGLTAIQDFIETLNNELQKEALTSDPTYIGRKIALIKTVKLNESLKEEIASRFVEVARSTENLKVFRVPREFEIEWLDFNVSADSPRIEQSEQAIAKFLGVPSLLTDYPGEPGRAIGWIIGFLKALQEPYPQITYSLKLSVAPELSRSLFEYFKAGVITANELRSALGLEPVPEGNKLIVSTGGMPVSLSELTKEESHG